MIWHDSNGFDAIWIVDTGFVQYVPVSSLSKRIGSQSTRRWLNTFRGYGKKLSKLCENVPRILFKAAMVYLWIPVFHAFSAQVLYQLDWCTCSQMIWHKRCGQMLTATAQCPSRFGSSMSTACLLLSTIHFRKDELKNGYQEIEIVPPCLCTSCPFFSNSQCSCRTALLLGSCWSDVASIGFRLQAEAGPKILGKCGPSKPSGPVAVAPWICLACSLSLSNLSIWHNLIQSEPQGASHCANSKIYQKDSKSIRRQLQAKKAAGVIKDKSTTRSKFSISQIETLQYLYPWAKNQQCLPWGAASESVQQCCWDLRLHLVFGGLELSYQLFVVNPCYHLFPRVWLTAGQPASRWTILQCAVHQVIISMVRSKAWATFLGQEVEVNRVEDHILIKIIYIYALYISLYICMACHFIISRSSFLQQLFNKRLEMKRAVKNLSCVFISSHWPQTRKLCHALIAWFVSRLPSLLLPLRPAVYAAKGQP